MEQTAEVIDGPQLEPKDLYFFSDRLWFVVFDCTVCVRSLEQTLFSLLALPRSVVFDQAENRLHAQKARMLN